MRVIRVPARGGGQWARLPVFFMTSKKHLLKKGTRGKHESNGLHREEVVVVKSARHPPLESHLFLLLAQQLGSARGTARDSERGRCVVFEAQHAVHVEGTKAWGGAPGDILVGVLETKKETVGRRRREKEGGREEEECGR